MSPMLDEHLGVASLIRLIRVGPCDILFSHGSHSHGVMFLIKNPCKSVFIRVQLKTFLPCAT